GERNNGFDVLYHNMKHGHLSTKDLADFIRERATIEEAYSRSMTKLAKSASNYTQLGTFAPVWDVFKTSTEKLASCHLDLMQRLQELIKEVHKYGDEQIKTYKKTKEDVSGTLEAVQNIQSITQALQKSKENYNAKCVEQERLKKEGATQREIEKAAVKSKKATDTYKLYVEKYATFKSDFELKMTETAQKFQDIEEMHLLRMKEIIQSFSNTIKEIHLQIGEVHEEFINNMTNTTVESLIQKFAESKGTGKERPGPIEFEECNTSSVAEGIKPRKRKPFGLSGIMKKEKDTESVECPDADSVNFPDVDDEGYSIKPEAAQDILFTIIVPLNLNFYQMLFCRNLQIVFANCLQEFVLFFLILRNSSEMTAESCFKLYLYCIIRLSVSMDISICFPLLIHLIYSRPTTPLSVGTIVPPPRPASRPKLSTGKLSGINEISLPRLTSSGLSSGVEEPKIGGRSINIPSSGEICVCVVGNSGRVKSSGEAEGKELCLTLSYNFSCNFFLFSSRCIVKITGDMTISFPSGIIKVFTSNPSPAVLCFRVKNTSKLEQILPNAQLVYSDQSQSDSSTKDFWMNMQAITVYLKKLSEQNPSASYYNVDVLKYQVSSNGIQSTPLNLATYWKCDASTTDVRVDYKYNPESMNVPSTLSNVQVVVPVDGGVINMQSLPPAKWNADQMKACWKISSISEKSENGGNFVVFIGSGSLRAKFELSGGPSKPATLAVQFISEGSTLSGADVELVGTGYRLSLLKKRFATGKTLTC
ncbi:FCHO2 protein, partial [Copsychus sechellarum]|nr:FCHO2 protein [Copsychus sechellarum]